MLTSLRKDRLQSAKNFALYYGYGKVKELSLFDVVIIDSNGLKPPEYERLKLCNTLVITYISLMEVHPSEPIFQELSKEDLILIDGEPLKNEPFGTFLVSLQSKKWIQYLLGKINRLFHVLEADGLFLDTIGDIEMPVIPKDAQQKQLDAAVNFLSVVRMLYPHHLFIQNNGLERVVQSTAPFIDGVCWENPPFTLEESRGWVQAKVEQLSNLKDTYKVKVFLLFEDEIEKERNAIDSARTIAKKQDFLIYLASKNYVDGVNI